MYHGQILKESTNQNNKQLSQTENTTQGDN